MSYNSCPELSHHDFSIILEITNPIHIPWNALKKTIDSLSEKYVLIKIGNMSYILTPVITSICGTYKGRRFYCKY